MVDLEESMGSQRQDHFVNLERRRDHEVSVHTTYTSRSHSRSGSHVSHGEETKSMEKEIDHLRRKLRRKQRKRSPSSTDVLSDNDESYRPWTRTPPSESYSYREERYHRQRSKSPTYKGLGNDAMSRALRQISKSPFTRRINRANLPRWFAQAMFTMYNGRIDPVEHANHFNQRMVVYLRNEALLCRVLPSSLGPVAIRWFGDLGEGSINSFQELTRAFGARFVTRIRAPRPLDFLLSMTMRDGETLRTYSNKYWEMFNEIDRDFEDVAIRTFKVSLPTEHNLRKSLTRKPARSMLQLMDRIDEYKRVKEN